MPNITPVDTNQPGDAAVVIDAVKSKLGSVPNIMASMAQSPAVLEAYLAFGSALDTARLSASVREQIALTVAGVNECDYCASAHTFIAKNLGIDAFEAGKNLAGRATDPKTDAILSFTIDVVRERASFPDTAGRLNQLRNAGVSDAEIVEIIATIAINIFTNYFNHIVDTDVDFPFVDTKFERPATQAESVPA